MAVLDANVLASGLLGHNPASPPVQALDAWRSHLYTLAVSEQIILEVARTLERPYFARRIGPAERFKAISLLRTEAITTANIEVLRVATHPEDDLILATAVSARADYLVTGDSQLQKLGHCQGVTILSPRDFANLLARPHTT